MMQKYHRLGLQGCFCDVCPMDDALILGITLPDLLLHISYLLLVLGSLVRTILPLRIMIIVSSVAGLISGYLTGYGSMVLWEAGFLLVNSIQVAIIVRERNAVHLTSEEKDLHARKFASLSPVDFHRLVRRGTWISAQPGEALTTQGMPVVRILLIGEGAAQVEIDGTVAAYCTAGDFVGEMAFVSGNPASATVTTMTETRYLMWRFEELRTLLEKHPEIRSALQTVFSKNLIEKLARDIQDPSAAGGVS
jgi:CRP-like cAMP-binding protein